MRACAPQHAASPPFPFHASLIGPHLAAGQKKRAGVGSGRGRKKNFHVSYLDKETNPPIPPLKFTKLTRRNNMSLCCSEEEEEEAAAAEEEEEQQRMPFLMPFLPSEGGCGRCAYSPHTHALAPGIALTAACMCRVACACMHVHDICGHMAWQAFSA